MTTNVIAKKTRSKGAKVVPRAAKPTGSGKGRTKGKTAATKPRKPAKAPRQTRGDEVIELLRRKNGATIEEMVTRFGIQAHTLRAVISVETRKRGLAVERPEQGRYRIS
jgi:hypothetical protein